MPDQASSHKLTEDQQMRVCQWIAELKKTVTIVKLCRYELKVELSRQAVDCYRTSKKWKPVIDKLYDSWVQAVLKVPIANKIQRLENLQRIHKIALTHHVSGETKAGRLLRKQELSAAVAANTAALREMEGNNLTVKGEITHNHILSEAIKKAKEGE